MSKVTAVLGIFLASGLIVASPSQADPNIASSTLNQHLGYLGASVGEPTSPLGAQVTISAERAGVSDYGGVIYTTSAQAWTNQVVRVSAFLGAASPNAKPWLWVRADGSSGKSLRFATSAGRPASADGHIYIDLRIPPDATNVVFGVAMRGAGEVVAKEVKLAISEQKIPGSEASAEAVYSEALKVVLDHAYRSSDLPVKLRDLKPELSSRPGTGYQAEKAVRALLRQLNDSHSIYVSAEEAYRYSTSGGNPDLAPVSLIDGEVGYVLMPAVGGTDPELALEFATKIGRRLRDINPQAHCGWVVDLRTNTGGSMWPMVSALGLFFGDERLGGFKDRNGRINWWSMKSRWVTPVAGQSEAHDAKIAVLLGSRTASSGEAVAVAFIGREGTQSFGMATSGKASSNRKFPLPDGSAIYLTTAVDVDRFGREVGERVVPDVLLSEEVVSRSEVPKEALDWLTTSCPRRRQ